MDVQRGLEQQGRQDQLEDDVVGEDDAEIDLIIRRPNGETLLIEIKSSRSVTAEQAHKLERFSKSFTKAKPLMLSMDEKYKRLGEIDVYPWQDGVRKIFGLEDLTHRA